MPKVVLMLILSMVFLAFPAGAETPQEAVRAYFVGYQENDVVFRIVNESGSAVSIKGLAFNRQILYRPVDKDAVVPASSVQSPYRDMVFRTTGDFVWSENHMGMFQLAYQSPQRPGRLYGGIYPQWPPLVSQKELVTETVP